MVKRCANGHFFDGDRFPECPYCIKLQESKKNPAGEEVIFASGKNEEPVSKPAPVADPVTKPTPEPVTEPTVQPEPAPEPVAEPTVQPEPAPEPVAEPTVQPEPAPEPVAEPTVQPEPAPEPVAEPTVQPEPAPELITDTSLDFTPDPDAAPLPDLVMGAVENPLPMPEDSTDGNELPGLSMGPVENPLPSLDQVDAPAGEPELLFASTPEEASDLRTSTEPSPIPEPVSEAAPEPFPSNYTVGWLVCVGGSAYGEAFAIRSGANSIGRSANVNISLDSDMEVTEQAHAMLLYDSNENKFSIQPGETVKIAYKNGEPVYKNEPLDAGDIITVGATKLLLFPLLRNGFNWTDYKEEN